MSGIITYKDIRAPETDVNRLRLSTVSGIATIFPHHSSNGPTQREAICTANDTRGSVELYYFCGVWVPDCG